MKTQLGITVLGLFVVAGFASHATGGDSKSKKTGLEGTWQSVKKDSRVQQLKIVGNTIEVTIGGNVHKGTFKLKNKENPLQIDIKIITSPSKRFKGKTALGIYDFQGETLRWCSSQPGRKRRPSQFKKIMGDALLILGSFKKKK
jgi:uncharacterized protein (TIGR03067 family)